MKPTLTLLTALLMISLAVPHAADAKSTKPNILFIYTDDQRWDAIGYVNPLVKTPNLDRLSAKGIRFNQAFIVLPVCSPSRATVLTGRYAMAHGGTDYSRSPGATEKSFADYLNKAGYLTAAIGKWHVPGRTPEDFGFKEVREIANGSPYLNPPVKENGTMRTYNGYSEDYCVEQAIDFMKRTKTEGAPFAIWLCTLAPHGRESSKGGHYLSAETQKLYGKEALSKLPIPESILDDLSGKPPYLKTYRGHRNIAEEGPMTPDRYRAAKNFFGQITEMDRALGRLFAALQELGLQDSTYVVFMSDNGLFRGEHGLMSKALHYEESIRVPMFVVGPGIAAGLNETNMVTNADIAPTLLDLAGVEVPSNMHGRSLKDLLLRGYPLDRPYVLFELPDAIRTLETRPAYALRSVRWKYIQTFEDGKDQPYTFEELYNLQVDPLEMSNVANKNEHNHLVTTLRAALHAERSRCQK